MLRQIQQKFHKQPTEVTDSLTQKLNDEVQEEPPSSVPPLTDNDYEFLFTQLLEGVAHGWHPERIVKFFQQLGERGSQQQWVAWLEKYSTKILSHSRGFEQQLAARMIRFGELTQASPSVREFGTFVYHLGRQLLYGKDGSLVWEYDGSDLVAKVEIDAFSSDSALEEEAIINNSSSKDTELFSTTSFQEAEAIAINEDIAENNQKNRTIKLNIPAEDTINSEITSESDLEEQDEILEELLMSLEPNELNYFSQEAISDLEEDTLLQDWSVNVETNALNSLSEETNSESEAENLLLQDLSIGLETDAVNSFAKETTSKETTSDFEPEQQEDNQQIDISGLDSEIRIQTLIDELNPVRALEDENSANSSLISSEDKNLIKTTELDNSTLELVEGWFNLGLKQASAGDLTGAIASWEKALELNPHLSEAWHNRGSALGRLGKYEEAINSFEKALVINSVNYQAWNDRGHALYQLQKWEQAIASWDKAIEIMPGEYQFWYNRGCALEQLELQEESIASYEKALEIKPDFDQARSRYINLLADKSQTN